MRWVYLISLLLVACASTGCAKMAADERAAQIKAVVDTLNDAGVVYSGTLEGPTEAGFELYSGGRAKTGGWISLRLQSPVANPKGAEPQG